LKTTNQVHPLKYQQFQVLKNSSKRTLADENHALFSNDTNIILQTVIAGLYVMKTLELHFFFCALNSFP